MEVIVIFRVVERAVRTYGRRLDSGNSLHTLQQLRPERVLLLTRFVLRDRQRDWKIYNAIWLETERRVLRVPKTFQCQACAGEQNNRKRGLHNH
jgi:hypothetical protein